MVTSYTAMRPHKKRVSLVRTFAAPLLVAWILLVAIMAAVKLAAFPTSTTRLDLQLTSVLDGDDLVLSTHSLCGHLPLDAVDQLIPADMVYFQRRWQQSKRDWALALTWLVQQVSGTGHISW